MFDRSIPASRHTCKRSASFHEPAPCASLTPFSLARILHYCFRRILCPHGKKRNPRWISEDSEKLLQEYYDAAQGQKAETAVIRERLADALADDLRLLQQQMIEDGTYLL